MWIIQEPKKVALWNKRHFEEGKKRGVCSMFKIFSTYICWINLKNAASVGERWGTTTKVAVRRQMVKGAIPASDVARSRNSRMRPTDITSRRQWSMDSACWEPSKCSHAVDWKWRQSAHLLLKASYIASFISGTKYCLRIIAGDVQYFETWPKSTHTRGPWPWTTVTHPSLHRWL
jgi:hypothetical protein